MKLIPSLAHSGQVTALERENDEPRNQLAKITKERDDLQNALRLAAVTAPVGHANSTSHPVALGAHAMTGHAASSAAVQKSYLNPTKASHAHSQKPATATRQTTSNNPTRQARFGTTTYTYNDGKISDSELKPRYMLPTNSSFWKERGKAKPKTGKGETAEEKDRKDDQDSAGRSSATASSTSYDDDGDSQIDKTSCSTVSLPDTIPNPPEPCDLAPNWIMNEPALAACFLDNGRAFDFVDLTWGLVREAL